jgi:hypothetical protein
MNTVCRLADRVAVHAKPRRREAVQSAVDFAMRGRGIKSRSWLSLTRGLPRESVG